MSLFDIFSRKKTLKESGLMDGFADSHSHLLAGVDDGIQTEEETLELLALMEENGVKECWFTPHIMEDVPNETQALRDRFDDFKARYKGGVKISLSAEYMLDNLFSSRLSAGDLLPHKGRSLLVECSTIVPPYGLEEKMEGIKHKGFFPLLAHPERYLFLSLKDFERLKSLDVKFQLNITSLLGLYGPAVQDLAAKLLEKGYYNCVGTDTHRVSKWKEMLDRQLKQKHIDLLGSIVSSK